MRISDWSSDVCSSDLGRRRRRDRLRSSWPGPSKGAAPCPAEYEMPKLDLDTIEPTNRTSYPEPFSSDVAGRSYRRIGDAPAFKDSGASPFVLTPGATYSHRTRHEDADETLHPLASDALLHDDD